MLDAWIADCQMPSAYPVLPASLGSGGTLFCWMVEQRRHRRSGDRLLPSHNPRSLKTTIRSRWGASRVAAHQHLAVCITNRETWLAVIMGGTTGDPAASGLAPAEGLGDGVSGSHGQGLRRRHLQSSDGVEMKVICLVSLNVGQPIKNATAQLQEPGTTALPSPLFEGSR